MKKIITIIWVVLWLILINYFSINAYYNNLEWKKLYENKDFSWALNYFEKNKDYIWLYNLWDIYYKLGEEVPLSKSFPQREKDLNKKIKYWEKSVDYFKNSLKLKYDKKTEEKNWRKLLFCFG